MSDAHMHDAHLHHTHLMASDLDATIAFWTECFGATLVADTTMASVRNVFLKVGGGRLNLYDQPPNHRGPVNHLGIQVADVAAVVDRLVARGWSPRPIKTDGPLTYAMVEGPDQLLLEIFHFDAATLDPALRPHFDLDDPAEPSVERGLRPRDEVLGVGTLSDPAKARLARPPVKPLRPPNRSDHAAVSTWREMIHQQWLAGDPTAAECGFQEVMVGGVRCLRSWARRAGSAGQLPPLIIYFHGGGYALGSPEVALPITQRLVTSCEAEGSGLDLISVGYRLAPEHPYPAAVEDGMAVYKAIVSSQLSQPLVLAGDSAGANLALAIATRLLQEEADTPGPCGLILLSPHLSHHLDLDPDPDRKGGRSDDPLSDVDETTAAWLRAAYLAETASEDPGASPLLADLAGLPPVLIQVGTIDGSLNHGASFARRARAAGVEVTLDVWSGLWHTWHYHRDLPEADQAITEAAAFAVQCAARPRHKLSAKHKMSS